MPSVSIIQDHPSHSLKLRPFKVRAIYLLNREGKSDAKVNVILSDDRLLRRLNKQYRKKDKSTDVLSFNFDDPDFLGEIYISLDKARKQAREYGATFEKEVERLMVHGLFHLLGFTHYRRKERLRMEKKEKAYLG